MSRNGRPPKPRALKELTGTLRKSRDKGVKDVEPAEPTAPEWLGPVARAEWERIVPLLLSMRVLTAGDGTALAAYCQVYERWRAAELQIREKGMTFTSANGYTQQRPEVTIAAKASAEMRAYLVEFGLTPASRQRVEPAPRPLTDNPFLRLPGADPLARLIAKHNIVHENPAIRLRREAAERRQRQEQFFANGGVAQ